jgi:hypothetical protein
MDVEGELLSRKLLLGEVRRRESVVGVNSCSRRRPEKGDCSGVCSNLLGGVKLMGVEV